MCYVRGRETHAMDSEPILDAQFFKDLQSKWEDRSKEPNFPANARSPLDLAQHIVPIQTDVGTQYSCKTCHAVYTMTAWAIKHLMDKHLDPDMERTLHCHDCNVKLRCRKGENKAEMLARHENSASHKITVKYPTMSGHGKGPIFCPNEGCGKIFKDRMTGRKHKTRCDTWSVEKRKAIKNEYMAQDDMKRTLEGQRTAYQLGRMAWDAEEPRPLTAEEITEDDKKMAELWEEIMGPIKEAHGASRKQEEEEEEATKASCEVVMDEDESDKENIPPHPIVQKRRRTGTKPPKMKKRKADHQ